MNLKHSFFLLIMILSTVSMPYSCQQRFPMDESAGSPFETTEALPPSVTVPSVTKPMETNPSVTVPPILIPAPTETTPLHKHSYGSEVINPGCQTEGYTIFACFCGDMYQSDKVAAVGHKWGDWNITKEASATEEGERTRTCSVCNALESCVLEKLPAETMHTHSYTAKVVPATCAVDGYTAHTCVCGDYYTDNTVPTTGHQWGDWMIVSEANTTEEGRNMRVCAACEATEIETIPVIPMDNSAKELHDPATDLEAEIARLFLGYINQYRKEDGSTELIYLSGMSQVAQYRSRQLVTNMAHDTADIRQAAGYYKYGRYINWADYGCPELIDQNYYDTGTQEAIGETNIYSTPEEVAREMAEALRNSVGHWRYVGSSNNTYAGVGVTYTGAWYYLCVMVGDINYG